MTEIESVLHENRTFPPPAGFQKEARLANEDQYQRMYRESIDDPEGFWGRVALEIPWMVPFGKVLDWSQAPVARWFDKGKLNASAVCLDQHLEKGRGTKRAIVWEGEPGDTRTFTYEEVHAEVCRLANALRSRGIQRGDRVAIYMPMIPELAFALLACARIGAIAFGGVRGFQRRSR